MESNRGTLTLSGIKEKKKEVKRLIADGRYLLNGSPRVGGIAAVYKAYDTLDEKTVAIKLFRSIHDSDDIVEESFRRETQALSSLRHPNIVEIIDSGLDMETGEHFIAMEWVGQDLESYRATESFPDWKSFYGKIGRQILEAIAFAHTHATIHRDIKPSNILITTDGIVKVCDFGISKIRNFLEPGVTLAQYASIPYAPPEPDDGSYSYSRDVFGFAALCISILSKNFPTDHLQLHKALDQLQIDESVKRIMRRAISLDSPSDRPATATVLLGELDRLIPKVETKKLGSILLSLTKKVRDILNVDLGIVDELKVQQFVLSDLSGAKVTSEPSRPNADGSAPLGPTIKVLGNKYGYLGVMAPPLGDKLLLVSALEYVPSQLEEYRDDALESAYEFSFSSISSSVSVENIKKLQESLVEFVAEQKSAMVEKRRQSIYNTWLNLLTAKTELERKRRKRIEYSKLEASGSAIKFFFQPGAEIACLDDQDVRIELGGKIDFTGTVVSIFDDSVLVSPNDRNKVEHSALPDSGYLIVDTTKSDAALDKQKSALEIVRFGRSVNPSLGTFIVSPGDVPVGHPPHIDFIQENIDEDKKIAIQVAMSNPELLLVQGPPGTGKTTFITELVLQTLRRDPESRILLTSQTHVALDNSLERITAHKGVEVQAVRIGHEDDERISPSMRELLVDNKLVALRTSALAQGKIFLEKWAKTHGVDMTYAKTAMSLERRASLFERIEFVEGRLDQLRPMLAEESRSQLEPDQRADLDQELGDRIKEKDGLNIDIKESIAEIRKYVSDPELSKHFENCSAEELRNWAIDFSPKTDEASKLRKLLVIHSEWESRFGRSREFKAALIASSQVVAGTCLGVMSIPGRQEIEYDLCIVDEASIATPTEVLVPMSRARRSILVGDSKQLSPFQDPELQASGLLQQFNLSPQDQKTTLFNHLSENLPGELKKTLTSQHRMLPAIGNLISECFYSSTLNSVHREPLGYLAAVIKKPVVWYSTSRFSNRGSKKVGTSCVNDLEVQQVIALLARINFSLVNAKGKKRKISVAVLTGYSPQMERIRSEVERKRHQWDGFSNIFVNVVDAFQGREADIAIFTVTRSDNRGLGFLKEMERINVALSRGKEYLIIIGDHLFCLEADAHKNPLKDVITYIQGHPNDCALEEILP